jgi:hypothetical protein
MGSSAHCFKNVNYSNIWGLSYSSLISSTVMKPYLNMSCLEFRHQFKAHYFLEPGW